MQGISLLELNEIGLKAHAKCCICEKKQTIKRMLVSQAQSQNAQQQLYPPRHPACLSMAGQQSSADTEQDTESPSHCASDREEYSRTNDAFSKQVRDV